MGKRTINGIDFANMALTGAEILKRNAEKVNALNVFPVPDGDTGTNMNLTMTSGVAELKSKQSEHLGKTAEALSKGLLMGARGNSGVILSQLFRGFSKSLANLNEATAMDIASALQHGVDVAYKAVVKPVEGTILTVAKEAAKHALTYARRQTEVTELMQEVLKRAQDALDNTPNQLPVLKQVGVVDSGGQGLVHIYEGMVSYLTGGVTPVITEASTVAKQDQFAGTIVAFDHVSAQAQLETLDIEFFYDMEFFIKRTISGNDAVSFDESAYKTALSKDGDSILVIVEDDIIKVHVHSRRPGDVFNLSVPYGELTDMHILNMREQHRELLAQIEQSTQKTDLSSAELLAGQAVGSRSTEQAVELAPFGMIAVSMGDGIAELFKASDVDIVLSGGQTMNPSTEDFVKAINSLSAEHVFIFPNNSNIILAAEQAAELVERGVTVIPTKSIPQGIAAVLAFKEDETPERNKEWMLSAASMVVSGQVTTAVRDTSIDGVEITEGHFIGIKDKTIVTSEPTLIDASKALLSSMLEQGGDILTILTGEGSSDESTSELCDWIEEQFSDIEVELQQGGQPLYPYIFAIE